MIKYSNNMYKKYVKRWLDFICSGIGLVILSPVMLIIACLVRIKLGSPVLFVQKRPGLNEKIFNLYKFRTMTDAKDTNGKLLPDDKRLTEFGKKLRSTSLDELPELINIFKGEMSIVGPRPLLIDYLPYYSEKERERHTVRPGLSGLAQISGRNYLEWDVRLAKDVEYVETLSFINDLKIIYKTIIQVFKHNGVAIDADKIEGNLAEIRRNTMV